MKKFFINVSGGLGLNLGLASFISYIMMNGGHKDYEFNVCSPYYDVFQACEYVNNVYTPQELKDLIFDCKASGGELVMHRLYDMNDFIFKRINYSQAWAELMNIPFKDTEKGTKVKSVLNPLKKYPNLQQSIDKIKQLAGDDYAIMQFTGGQSPLVQVPSKVGQDGKPTGEPDWSKVPYNYDNEPLKRHYPIEKVQEFVNLYHEKYPNRKIILYQLPNEPAPIGDFIIRETIPYLAYYELAKNAAEIVTIDSSLQHLTSGLTKTTVLWAHSKPENFGYSCNNNIEQKCRTDDLLYFSALGPSGAKVSYIEPSELLKALAKEVE